MVLIACENQEALVSDAEGIWPLYPFILHEREDLPSCRVENLNGALYRYKKKSASQSHVHISVTARPTYLLQVTNVDMPRRVSLQSIAHSLLP